MDINVCESTGWYEILKIDVFIPTYNSERHLDNCLKSVFDSFPIKRIIIIDRYSTDSTVKIAVNYGCEIIYDANGLARARELSFKLASTEIFATVESDIVYKEKAWFDKAVRLFSNRVGAVVAYVPRLVSEPRGKYSYILSRYTPLRKRKHGFTAGSTLWLREAVRGIRIPAELKAYEDIYIERVLRKRGWSYRYIEVKGYHFSTLEDRVKARWYGANARIFHSLTSDITLLRRNVTLPFKAAIVSLLGFDPKIFQWSFVFTFNFILGWSNPKKYSDLKR